MVQSRRPVRRPSVQALRHSRRGECAIMDAKGRFSISPEAIYVRLGTGSAPIVVDVRRSPAFDANDKMIVGAVRRLPEAVDHWCHELPEGRSVVVYCAHGQEVSQNTAAALRAAGTDACYLEHGIGGWAELGLPRRRKLGAGSDGWVTRERPKIDRIACPWLIRRFIDHKARFLFAPTERVFAVAAETGATQPTTSRAPSRFRMTANCAVS